MFAEFQKLIGASDIAKNDITRVAGFDHRYLNRLLAQEVKLTRKAFMRVRLAISRIHRRDLAPDGQFAAASYRLAVAIVAERFGAQAAEVLAADPGKRATADPAWMQAAKLRRLALYIANIYLEIPQAELARAAGMSKAAVSIAMNAVEDLRGDSDTEAMLKAIEEAFA